MENFYKIDHRVLAIQNTPIARRKSKAVKWFEVLLSPIVKLHIEFLEFRKQILYKANHNSQICFLQAVLNDSFDPVLRRIKIRNAILKEPLWFYEAEENKPIYFYEESDNKPVYFREEGEFVGDGADFLVLVPFELKPVNTQEEIAFKIKMQAKIDYYKLFVKNNIIQWVEIN